jgi:hypothetical protein
MTIDQWADMDEDEPGELVFIVEREDGAPLSERTYTGVAPAPPDAAASRFAMT